MFSKELLKGTLEPLILQVLRNGGRMYGYEIAQRVKVLSHEQILISEGALYPILHRLEKKGVLCVEKVKVGRRTRKYYTLTEEGQHVAAQAVGELQGFLSALQALFSQLPPNPQVA